MGAHWANGRPFWAPMVPTFEMNFFELLMMNTDTVTVSETMRGSQVHGTSPPDTRHMSTAVTWSPPEPWDPGPQIKNIDSFVAEIIGVLFKCEGLCLSSDISSNTRHMSTAATWSQPEPWDPGPQIKNIDSLHFVLHFQIFFPHN